MIVSNAHKFVFVHIPKTGGTTIDALFRPLLDPARDAHITYGRWTPDNAADLGLDPKVRLNKHAIAPQIRRAMGAKRFAEYYRFAIVRNPFARLFSCYSFITTKARDIAEGRIEKRKRQLGLPPNQPDLSDFLDMGFDELCGDLPFAAKKLGLFKPQVHWLPTPDMMSFTARLESLGTDLERVFSDLGLADRFDGTVPHRNKKTSGEGWRSMDPASAERIRQFYAADFDRFGYSGDLGASPVPAADPASRVTGNGVRP